MFLLFLIGLRTAHVNAQVRIGGNAAPNGAAVLDLNATDAATGTKGLALPRVRLDSTTVQITPGVANLNGMMVYNTTATLGVGIYSWIGGRWKKVDAVTAPTPGDSAYVLISDGSSFAWRTLGMTIDTSLATATLKTTPTPVQFSLILDTTITVNTRPGTYMRVTVPGLTALDFCTSGSLNGRTLMHYPNVPGALVVASWQRVRVTNFSDRILCFRPSF